jgi:CheY-like chemotaxis protein
MPAPKVLIVEDEALVSMLLEAMLEDAGCDVVGPAPRVSAGVALVTSGEAMDAAILDVNVAGEQVFPVAEALAARGVPFAFASGYGEGGVPEMWRDRPVLQKPFGEPELRGLLQKFGLADAGSLA